MAAIDDPGKTQGVRLADVFFIGPLMIWGGLELAERYPVGGGVLAVLGVATIGYNARNYLRLRPVYAAPQQWKQAA